MFKVENEDKRLTFCYIYGVLQHIEASVILGKGELKLKQSCTIWI